MPEIGRAVQQERVKRPPDPAAVRAIILDPAVSWPWSSGDPRIADLGVIGEARAASVEHGQAIIERVLEAVGPVLKQLIENRKARGQQG